ncbi:MAG: LysM peptidoglycan-binding domain-containing protein [Bacteroidia bacterium]|nr:LysM peptidoglycan-binding domain-containing protein [Bacteroidia bacterium]
MRYQISLFLIIFLGLISGTVRAEIPEKPIAPRTMGFCGMNLELTPACQAQVQEMIDRLYKSESYFQTLLDRCDTYMPFVEDAFELARVPDDLKYICILESALIGDAVSKSNAVGFWQFKDFTAREVGLIVGPNVDERKHIFRSSLGAARYFTRLHRDFDNWIYAVIGYNQGPSGAIPYTKSKYYGAKSMVLEGDLHPYAVKTLAHKIAFEKVIGKNPEPRTWLEPRPTGGETSVPKLASEANLTFEELREYNLWILNPNLPSYVPFTYYIPHKNEPVLADLHDPNRDQYEEGEGEIAQTDPATQPKTNKEPSFGKPNPKYERDDDRIRLTYNKFENRDILHDPDYDQDFVLVKEGELMVEIATHHDLNLKKLLEWNDMTNYQPLASGQIIRLRPRNKALYHIVQKGETIDQIAADYGKKPASLKKKNRMLASEDKIYPGQKLNLKKKKPARERIILFKFPWTQKDPEQEEPPKTVKSVEVKQEKSEAPADPTEKDLKVVEKEEPAPKLYKTEWVWHTVQKGETLWQLYKLYNCPVDIIKKLNNLNNNDLMPGQKLKIMSREEIIDP